MPTKWFGHKEAREGEQEKPREVGQRFEVVAMRPFCKTSYCPTLCNSESVQL